MTQKDEYSIVFVIFDGITQLDFAGPVQFLALMPGAKIHVINADEKPVATDCGFSILPNGNFADCPQADLLCIPGGAGVVKAIGDAEIVGFVRKQAEAAQWVTSVCTGAFILGAAGLLKGKRASTHWAYTHLLEKFGATDEKARVVRDGNLITAGGVTSGIDFALEVIAHVRGDDVAQSIQLACEYDPAPPFISGHPNRAPDAIVGAMKQRIYDTVAQNMADAINDIGR